VGTIRACTCSSSSAGAHVAALEQHLAAHEAFVDSLIERHLVLLGGGLADPVSDLHAAYVLRAPSLAAARALAADDPYFAHAVFEPVAVEWKLVGVDLGAVDSDLT
jgi:uncharacterized protein YciI